jgi:hypothetical protein
MSMRVFAVNGNSFDGGVVDPIPRPTAPVQKRELADEYMILLCKLDPDTPELKHLRDILLGRRIELNAESLKLIESERVKANAAVREEWEAQKKLCREQQKVIDALNVELAEVIREWNAATEKKSKTGMRVFDAYQRRKELSRFTSAEQTAKADGAIEKAQRAFEEAGAPEAEWRARRNDLVLTQIPNAGKELDKLATMELRLHAAVTGQGYTDPEFGIQVPPGMSL